MKSGFELGERDMMEMRLRARGGKLSSDRKTCSKEVPLRYLSHLSAQLSVNITDVFPLSQPPLSSNTSTPRNTIYYYLFTFLSTLTVVFHLFNTWFPHFSTLSYAPTDGRPFPGNGDIGTGSFST